MSTLQNEFIAVVESLSVKEAIKEGWIETIKRHPIEDFEYSKAYCRALFIYITHSEIKHPEALLTFLFECSNKHFENKSEDELLEAKDILDNQLKQLVQIAFKVNPEATHTLRSRFKDNF